MMAILKRRYSDAFLNSDICEYTAQLKTGQIQRTYKGIMDFMSELKAVLERKMPEFASSAFYFGYMDMTSFAFTPPALKKQKNRDCLFDMRKPPTGKHKYTGYGTQGIGIRIRKWRLRISAVVKDFE
jgi:hypothetical protein